MELLHDFGGEGPVIHLAHANGFPPGAYAPFAASLTRDCRVIGLPARPLWPGSRPASAPNWHTLAEDLIQGLHELDLCDIIGVGHSMGGVYTMLAAIQRPELFRALVLIDPVILPPSYLRVLRLLRLVGLASRQPLVQGALRRRRTWPNRQACYDGYRRKPFFANWPDASLRAYVEAGTRPQPDGGVELVYPTAWEAHIFATPPIDVWRYVPQLHPAGPAGSALPLLVIRGEHSATFRPQSQRRMERLLPQAEFRIIPDAGHLAPMERPAETAAAITHFLAGIYL